MCTLCLFLYAYGDGLLLVCIMLFSRVSHSVLMCNRLVCIKLVCIKRVCVMFVCRKAELDVARVAGNTGTLTQYHVLAMELPQHLRVAVTNQVAEPQGYNPVRFGGPWVPALVLKTRVPPTYQSWRTETHWRTGVLYNIYHNQGLLK